MYEKAQKISTMPSVLQTLIQAPKFTPSVYMRSGGIKCAKCRFLKKITTTRKKFHGRRS